MGRDSALYHCKECGQGFNRTGQLYQSLCNKCWLKAFVAGKKKKLAVTAPASRQVIPGINQPCPGETVRQLNEWRCRYGLKPVVVVEVEASKAA